MDLSALVHGFSVFFQPHLFLLSILAVIIGIMVGGLPGLTATMACGLLVPFTFGFHTVTAFVLLIGVYCGAIYGGSMSAILINIPGTAAAAATMIDGYQMTLKDQAGKALGMAAIASCIGGVASALFMTFFSPPVAKIALKFGPPEYFGIAMFALSALIFVSGKSLTKGLISAVFGLVLTTIGMDPNTGDPRFTFGSAKLLGGIELMSIVIGMFAFAQVFVEIDKPLVQSHIAAKIGRILPSWEELKRVPQIILKSTLIGTIIGITPAIGCETACFVAYGEAKRSSKHPEKFGTGVIEGVAAPEAANNASTGGDMIPMLTLGIPGDATTGVMIGAFILHGITPGPLLFRDHMDVVYPIFATMIMSNIIMGVSGIALVRFFARVILIRKSILFSVILAISIVGCYAIRFSFFDVGMALALGFIGYFMRYYDYPISPVVIAFILGPIAEQNYCRSLVISRGSYDIFFKSPICLIFLILGVASLIFALIQRKKMAQKEKVHDLAQKEAN